MSPPETPDPHPAAAPAHVTTHAATFHAPVQYHIQTPSEQTDTRGLPLVVALHGMGMSGQSFLRVLRHLGQQCVILAPNGPYPFEKRAGSTIQIGYGWYIYRGDQVEFREHLERSEAFLNELVTRVANELGTDNSRTTLLGFSQGGYLAGFAALRNPDRYPGLVIASSRLKHEFLTTELATRRLPRTLFLHSAADQATPLERMRDGLEQLVAHGGVAELYEHDAGHRLPPDALQHMAAWQQRQELGPREGQA
ncbi:MAG: alpha/beta fold hydrolase [Planctomycetota bacterium]